MEIVRVTPVNSDREDEATMERVASPVVVEAVEDRADVPSSPGPFSEDITMDDFLPRPTRGSVVFLAFSDW
jgi:hypothetical protein